MYGFYDKTLVTQMNVKVYQFDINVVCFEPLFSEIGNVIRYVVQST